MNAVVGEQKDYHVAAESGTALIDVYRAAMALSQQRPDVFVRPVRFTNLERANHMVQITTADETVVDGFRHLVEVARELRQSPPEELPQEVLRDPQMREIVLMGYLQEEARDIFPPQTLRQDVAARSA